MRSYLIYKWKARRWNADREIQALVAELTPRVSHLLHTSVVWPSAPRARNSLTRARPCVRICALLA
jgi:hypothetical protein